MSLNLTVRYPLIRYFYDYHDARAHAARARAAPEQYPHLAAFVERSERDPDAVWVRPTPTEMAETSHRVWSDRFRMVLDDLARMPAGSTVLAEGWGLRPELVAPLLDSPRRAIFLVPTEAFRQHQLATLPRAGQFSDIPGITDREKAQRNRIERANGLGLRVIHVDGEGGPERALALVEEHFRPYLPRWIY